MTQPHIDIVEVGPRDGLQNDPSSLTTDQKLEFVARLEAAGVKRMESGSFVSPKAVPKMADSGDVFRGLDRRKDTRHIALALNEKGVRRAIDAAADEINFVLVASKGFGERNQGMTPEQSMSRLAECAPLVHEAGIALSATISVAFGDPYDGEVDIAILGDLAGAATSSGAVELALGDTIGVATPWDVRERFAVVRQAAPDLALRAHFHDTRGQALANVAAAVDEGVTIIDASCGGIGGCPFAPGATGNVATEDVVYLLHRGGFKTGIDLGAMIETAHWLESALGHPISSNLARAGGFPA